MKNFKSILFLILCGSLGIGLGSAFTHFWHSGTVSDPSKPGTGSPPKLRGFSLPAGTPTATFDPLLQFHTSALALEYPNSPDALKASVTHAHALGLKVLLQPSANFSSKVPYPQPLSQIAAEADTAGVDILCVSWLNIDPDPAYWQKEIAAARKYFHGQILLACTPEVLPAIEFTGAADLLGIIGPVNLPRRLPHAAVEISEHDMEIGWSCWLDSFESISNHTGKKIVLLNMTVPAAVATKIPLTAADAPQPDPALQKLVYDALLIQTRGRANIEAIFLRWSPEATPQAAAADPLAANHLPKLLTDIVAQWSPAAPSTTVAAAATTEPDDPDTDDATDP